MRPLWSKFRASCWLFHMPAGRLYAVLFASLLGLSGFYSALAVYKAHDYTTTPRQPTGETTPRDFGMPYDVVSFPTQSDDSLILQGWWIGQERTARAIVLVHGRYQNRTSMLDLARRLWERGYSLLLFDLRGHGMSPSASCTYGLREQWDVLGAVDFVAGQGIERDSIGVLGWSLGGASALMAMEHEPGLAAVVSDSAYADGSPLLARNLLRPGLKLALRVVEGVNIDDVQPARSVARAETGRVFLIHGSADRAVPIAQMRKIEQSGGSRVVEPWVVSDAGHLGAFARVPDEYVDRVDRFFRATLVAGAASFH